MTNTAVILDSEEFCLILKGKASKIKDETQNNLFCAVNGMVTFARIMSAKRFEQQKEGLNEQIRNIPK